MVLLPPVIITFFILIPILYPRILDRQYLYSSSLAQQYRGGGEGLIRFRSLPQCGINMLICPIPLDIPQYYYIMFIDVLTSISSIPVSRFLSATPNRGA